MYVDACVDMMSVRADRKAIVEEIVTHLQAGAVENKV